MNKQQNRGILFLFIFALIGTPACAMSVFPFNLLGSAASSDLGIAFLKGSDAARKQEQVNRQKQLNKLQAHREALTVRAEQSTSKSRKLISTLREELPRRSKGSMGHEVAQLLNDQAATASQTIEAYAELQKVAEEQEALLKKFIGTLTADSKDADDLEKTVTNVSWTQFKQHQQEIEDHKAKRNSLKEKQEILARDGIRLTDQQSLQKKQLAQRKSDLSKKSEEALDGVVKEQYQMLLKLHEDLMTQTTQYNSLSTELHEARVTLHDDQLALQHYVLSEQKRRLPVLKKRMVFVQPDIDLADQERKNQERIKEEQFINLARAMQRLRHEREAVEREKQSVESVQVQSEVNDAQRERVSRHLQLLDQQHIALEYKRELAEAMARQKELQLAILRVMQQRAIDSTGKIVSQRIHEWLTKFSQSKRRIDAFLEKLQDRAKENQLRSDEHHKYATVVAAKERGSSGELARVHRQISTLMSSLLLFDQELVSINTQQIKLQRVMSYDVNFILSELDHAQRSLNIWQRSDKALSPADLSQTLRDARAFLNYLYRTTLNMLSLRLFIQEAFKQDAFDYLQLFFFIFFLLFFIAGFRFFFIFAGRSIDRLLYVYQGQVWAIYLTILRSFLRFIEQHGRSIAIWLCVRLHIMFDYQLMFAGLQPLASPYLESLFFLCSIPFFLYMSRRMMHEVKTINQRMSFLFFTETLQSKFLMLLSSILYSSAILLPLRRAFMAYPFSGNSPFASVVYAAWTLVISIVFLLFFSKHDVLRLVPTQGALGNWLHGAVSRYYYPVFVFVMGLLILINPYVGYSNFAVYLAICLPASFVILYAIVMVHTYVRRYSLYMFIKEDPSEEDEGEDRFEHAKLYYGVFVLASFLALAAASFIVLTRIWGVDYSFAQLWKGLSQDWVLTIEETGIHIGFGGLLTIGFFIVGAFVISSLFNRFVLSKLFDIFRVAGGAQNTVTRILHYAIIFLAIILSLHAVRLGVLGNGLLVGLLVGISFGAKDLVSDFFAGFWILVERPIEPGNFIQTGELRGTVKKIAVRATTIRTARNFSVVIPNRELVSKPIINWGGNYYAVGFEMKITVSYHADPKKTQEIIRQVVAANGLVLRIPAVAVRLDNFGDHGLEYFVRAFISSRRVRDQWDIASDIRIELMKVFQENGIGIPYPHLVIQQENAFGLTKQAYEEVVAAEKKEGSDQ